MIDLASIRNASFSLTPTGYNPEEVDQFLSDLADQLAAMPAAPAPEAAHEAELVVSTHEPESPLPERPELPEPVAVERPIDQLDGLQHAVERTIAAMDSFVQTELHAVREASMLEVDEIHRERERLLEEAGEAARAHLDETRVRAERIVEEARHDGDEMRRRIEAELHAERDRFEQALAQRDAEANARVEAVLADAEDRRREAEQIVANAGRVQQQVLASIEHARDSLSVSAGQPAVEPGPAEAQEDDPWGPPAEMPRPMSLQSLIAEQRVDQPVESEPAAPADEADATDAAA
ncbi:MAG: DivIVA domain-containing protein [Gaiellales bacterium]